MAYSLFRRPTSQPSSYIAVAFRGSLSGLDALGLGVGEGPSFLALASPHRHVPHSGIAIFGAGMPSIDQQLGHGVDRDPDHAGNGRYGRPVAEHGEDLGMLLKAQLFHAPYTRTYMLSVKQIIAD